MKRIALIALITLILAGSVSAQQLPAYQDTSLPFEKRAADLVSRMTLDEKVSQLEQQAGAIDRLGVPAYSWNNECLHGVLIDGNFTVFPQSIGMAASWDSSLLFSAATAISDEARGYYNSLIQQGEKKLEALDFWSPNINIVRDPRWGRGQETYGEDPYLTSRMAVNYVRGLQGDDPKYLKVISTPKHFAVHSGPEEIRHEFNAKASMHDIWDTYLPAFEAAVREGGAYSVMAAYDRINGEPCPSNKWLLDDVLRKEWGFKGYVVSDCGAIGDIWRSHKLVATDEEAAARALKAGCDLDCYGDEFSKLGTCVKQGSVTEEQIDQACYRLMLARMKLGMFDPPSAVKYSSISPNVIGSPAHRSLAREAARKSIVLLKNAGNILPMDREKLKTIAVIGPYANSILVGDYSNRPDDTVTILQGICRRLGEKTDLIYQRANTPGAASAPYHDVIEAVNRADVTVLVLGVAANGEGVNGEILEGEDMDRSNIALSDVQERLLKAVTSTGKPVVLVLVGGSALAVPWAAEHVPGIVEAWYPGIEDGNAIADVLFGDCNPAGRLPITFYASDNDLPDYQDYSMANRTYRYFKGKPLFPFGFGLSYTKFGYNSLKLSSSKLKADDSLTVSATVKNAGTRGGDEVVEVYLQQPDVPSLTPIRKLVGFQRVSLAPGEEKNVSFTITPAQMAYIDNDGKSALKPGRFTLSVGGSQGDQRSMELGAAPVLTGSFEVIGP